MIRRFALPLLLALPVALASPPDAQSFSQPRDYDLRPLGESLGSYLEARSSGVGLDEAKAELISTLDTLRGEIGGGHPLARAADLGHALWLSREYKGQKLRPGKVTSEALEVGGFRGEGLQLAYRVPRDYDPSKTAYPLILAIPDWDEKGEEHLRAHWSAAPFREEAIVVCPDMPAKGEEWDQVVIDGRPGGLCHVLTALRIAGERFAIDFDRVYVAGRGKGVPTAVAAGHEAPQHFAGVIGRGGDVGERGPDNYGNLPTWFVGGGAEATAFREQADEAGFENCTVKPTGSEEELWQWIEEHPRPAWPTRVTVETQKRISNRSYWFRIAPSAPDARATATVDREKNTVKVEARGISHVILHLNDEIVDLERPVIVICGDVEHRAVVSRDLTETLDLIHAGVSDPGCVYTARVIFEVTGEEENATGAGEIEIDSDYDARRIAAGRDVEKLWGLYQWCVETDRDRRGRATLRRLLRVDPEHAGARTALGHQKLQGHWFTSEAALAQFRSRQEENAAKARGHVLHKSVWMHPEERKLVNKGREKDHETGVWTNAADRRRLAEGWARQDLEWIEPEQTVHVDEERWLVEGEWLSLDQANRRRTGIESMWHIPGPNVVLHCTASRAVSELAREEMGRAIEDLNLVFGAEPMLPLDVAVLRDEEQYDLFAFGAPDGRRPATHAGRMQVVHRSFFAESWFPFVAGKREWRGMGVCYWDSLVPNGNAYGVHAARFAVGLSYVDVLDPSQKAVRKALSRGPDAAYYAAYQEEKMLPAWLRFGGAVYAERFFRDRRPDVGDPWWARTWSLDNLRAMGDLRPLRELFAFDLDPDDRDDGLKLLIEAGLVCSFLVDGECAEVSEAHAKLKKALIAGKVNASVIRGLTEAISAHEKELRAYGGLE